MTAALVDGHAMEGNHGRLYPVAFQFDSAFGRCVGVDLAVALGADSAALLPLLHQDERPFCRTMRGARLVEFVGGRLAARLARAPVSGGDGPTLVGAGGMPMTAHGVSISISHCRGLAVALACVDAKGSVGVDVEPLDDDGDIELLAERILSDDEWRAIDSSEEPTGILRRLSIKEAAYKALFPRYGHVPLQKIIVWPPTRGAGFRVFATGQRIPVRAASRDLGGLVLSLARLM